MTLLYATVANDDICQMLFMQKYFFLPSDDLLFSIFNK